MSLLRRSPLSRPWEVSKCRYQTISLRRLLYNYLIPAIYTSNSSASHYPHRNNPFAFGRVSPSAKRNMYLINTKTYRLEQFQDPAEVPKYAILSHTWGKDEVLFKDMQQEPFSANAKKGYGKVEGMCKQALAHGHDYAWIDSCCIDKSSSAELSEAINSMFLWYKEAAVCYAYIEDMPAPTSRVLTRDQIVDHLKRSRWFSRGWTLQELLAPATVIFYDSAWRNVGTKSGFAHDIAAFTKIHLPALLGTQELSAFTVAQRMSWAAGRKTTRIEDRAYSLFGLFDVNLPPLYGERDKAFLRLQQEIIKHSPDLSILCWDSLPQYGPLVQPQPPYSLFAASPDDFEHCGGISSPLWSRTGAIATVQDLHIIDTGTIGLAEIVSNDFAEPGRPLPPGELASDSSHVRRYVLSLAADGQGFQYGIYLKKIRPCRFIRDLALPIYTARPNSTVTSWSIKWWTNTFQRNVFVSTRTDASQALYYTHLGVYLPFLNLVPWISKNPFDLTPVDCVRRVVFFPTRDECIALPLSVPVGKTSVDVLLVLHWNRRWVGQLMTVGEHPKAYKYFLKLSISEQLFRSRIPSGTGIDAIPNYAILELCGEQWRISVSVTDERETLTFESEEHSVYVAELWVERMGSGERSKIMSV
ncbi:hypothetical protein RB595_006607 [Gaeumannomyces hyphopodioides]